MEKGWAEEGMLTQGWEDQIRYGWLYGMNEEQQLKYPLCAGNTCVK